MKIFVFQENYVLKAVLVHFSCLIQVDHLCCKTIGLQASKEIIYKYKLEASKNNFRVYLFVKLFNNLLRVYGPQNIGRFLST